MGNKPQSRALTCAFLRPGAPTPAEWPLPHAPVGHPDVVLPVDGLNVLFGRSAPRVVSLALRRALQQGYRPVAIGLELALPRTLPGPVDLADLAAVSTLILDKTRVTVALATAIEDRLAAYLRAEGRAPELRRAAILFDLAGAHPHLLARLVREPEFAHLRAIGYTVPGGDGGPTCVLLYLRDLTAITRIDVQQAGAEPISFRLPTPAELATPAAGYNPFRAEASG